MTLSPLQRGAVFVAAVPATGFASQAANNAAFRYERDHPGEHKVPVSITAFGASIGVGVVAMGATMLLKSNSLPYILTGAAGIGLIGGAMMSDTTR